MYLPNEVVDAILESLGRRDLKSARLVCKTWCSCASPFLFDKTYVAPNRVDLEVFKAITQHPILSKCIRQLVYDCCEFVPNLKKRTYIEGLWVQTETLLSRGKISPHSSDPQINEWTNDVASRNFSTKERVTKWKHRDLIDRGYEEYQKHAVYQGRALRNGHFVDSLVKGLSRLVHLTSVTLDGEWPNSLETSFCEHHCGTPLARKWNPFHYCPNEWFWEADENDPDDLPVGIRHYWNITTALTDKQRQIDNFTTGHHDSGYLGISPEVFKGFDPMPPNSPGSDITALSGLKDLELHFASCNGRSAAEYCDNIERLPKLLGSMHSLLRLCLDLSLDSSYSAGESPNLYRHDQVFPQAILWNDLVMLELSNFSSSATDLLHLLLIQMPNLKHTVFGTMQLLDGCWESVVECLKQFHSFTYFEIYLWSFLHHEGGRVLRMDYGTINEYVMFGGRHPCLSGDQPASASEAYMLRIDTSLRDRLRLGADSSRSDVAM
ncbi:hypothetical protein IMSHALPRED_002608 [Imshaugia aleurites]|uniref:F-box domain-containing protein n=1 Tax=Imshaugia aleurites TaxID=172621 RepID=A0A8H3F1S0_9LECA|nr:hypothetical protein IMSHALPRED_002608 [Imshaugia aleurites]